MERCLVVALVIAADLIVVVSLNGCSQKDGEKEGIMAERRTIEQVQQAHTNQWMEIPGVQGTGIGLFENKPCIKIFSSKKAEELRGKIPSEVEGYPVIIEVTGTFQALDQK
jgi:hypothetical protein